MTSFCESHNYYKKMLELQEKLRKSEEERIRLEERFKLLLQESRNRHNTCINRLRYKYIEFLEEQRTTDERNYKLLEALDRVDNSLALMTARTDRLNSLRKQYEAYLRRICTARADGVNDISGRQSDQNVRTGQRSSLPSEVKSTLPLQSSWSNYQPIKSAFLSPSKTTKSRANISFDGASSSTVDLKTLGQRINDQSVSQTYSKHLQQDFAQVPTFHLSSAVSRQSQAYNNNARLDARDFQTDSNLQSLRVNAHRAAPRLAMPCYINTSGNNPLDISQNQTPRSILQHPVDPPRMQSLPLQQSHAIPLDHLQNDAPKSMERNVSDAALNFDTNRHPSYPNYSFNDEKQDKNCITDTFPRHLNNVNARELAKGANQTRLEDDEDKVSTTTDSEFDRYIDRIRKLHRDLDEQSLEEDRHRQDTNSDSFNATVLNNDSDLSTINKLDESLANKVKQVLELAENLVSRTMNVNGAECVKKAEEPLEEQKDHELRRTMESCAPVSEIRNHVEISDALEGHVTTPMAHAEERIKNDVALHQPKLNSRKNMESSKNQNSASTDGDHAFEQQRKQSLLELQKDNSVHSSQDNRIYIADESELDQYLFSVNKDLEPWNLDSVEKRVKDIDLIGDVCDQTVENDFIFEEPASNENKEIQIQPNIVDNRFDKHEARHSSEPVQEVVSNDASDALKLQNDAYFKVSETNDEDNEITASQLKASEEEDASSSNIENNRLQNVELPNTENISYSVELSNTENSIHENAKLPDNKYVVEKDDDDDEKIYNDEFDTNKDNMPRNVTLNEERSNRYYKEADHAKDSVCTNDVEYSNSNKYDQDEPDEYDEKEEYEGYANQECPQETNEQHEGYANEQYGQYVNNPENAYENDPNAQYQEDTDKNYSCHNEQYNSNHEFVADEDQQYEETKETKVPQQHEHETKQECSEEYTEHQKESQNERKDVLEIVDEDQSEEPPTTNEKKKGKDVIKSLLDSDTDSTLEQNISNTESDFDFN